MEDYNRIIVLSAHMTHALLANLFAHDEDRRETWDNFKAAWDNLSAAVIDYINTYD